MSGFGRRAFLRGAGGAALALPLLEVTHGRAFAQGMPTLRFLTFFEHGGTLSNMGTRSFHDGSAKHHGLDYWRPASPDEALELGPIMASLEPWKAKLNVLQGVDNRAAMAQDQYGRGGHRLSNVTALTAATVDEPEEDRYVALGASIDQVIAERLAATQPVRFQNLHLRVNGHNYGTPYFRAARESVSGESDPRAAFRMIFEGVQTPSGPDPEVVRARQKRRSVLDALLDSYRDFTGKVGASDKHKIDAHLDHLRALELELEDLPPTPACVVPEEPPSGGSADVVGPLHIQLMIAAIRCGLTNVANLQIADILTPWTATGTPMNQPRGHSLGHQAREVGPTGADASKHDGWVAEMTDNRVWRMSLMRQLVEGLDDPEFLEGDNTILDNSLVLYTSEFSNASQHVARNQPLLLAGGVGGRLQTGRNLEYNSERVANPNTNAYETTASTHNVYTSILRLFGGDDAHFGNGDAIEQGPIARL